MWDGSESKITKQVFVSLKYFSEQMEERTFKIKKEEYKRKVKEKSKKSGDTKRIEGGMGRTKRNTREKFAGFLL